jgi:hypothetical protein
MSKKRRITNNLNKLIGSIWHGYIKNVMYI